MPPGWDWTGLPLPSLLRASPLASRPVVAAEERPPRPSQGAGLLGLKAFATCHLLWYDLQSWEGDQEGMSRETQDSSFQDSLLPRGVETQGSAWMLLQPG